MVNIINNELSLKSDKVLMTSILVTNEFIMVNIITKILKELIMIWVSI